MFKNFLIYFTSRDFDHNIKHLATAQIFFFLNTFNVVSFWVGILANIHQQAPSGKTQVLFLLW